MRKSSSEELTAAQIRANNSKTSRTSAAGGDQGERLAPLSSIAFPACQMWWRKEKFGDPNLAASYCDVDIAAKCLKDGLQTDYLTYFTQSVVC